MSIANVLRIGVALGIVTAGLLAGVSCGPFEGEIQAPVFEIAGGHAELQCILCHTEGEPYGPLPTDCVSCHEADRKNDNHYAGQTCNGANGEGCHTSVDLLWADAAANIQHDFLPLEGSHGLECQACHADPAGGQDLVGQSQYCWNCHEAERTEEKPNGHYALAGDELNPFYRWDCGPCHDPVPDWGFPRIRHPLRVPHGAVITNPNQANACVTTAEEAWVYLCDDCHTNPADPEAYECLICHGEAHLVKGVQEYTEDLCTTACHASGGPDADGLNCDSLPD